MDCTRSVHASTPLIMYMIPCRWDHWRRKWQLTPAFFRGKSHGQGNLAGYSSWGLKELDPTEWLSTHRWDHSADSNGSQLWSAGLWELPITSTFREALESEGDYWVNGHESEPTLGDGEGQGSLVCCSPWGCRVEYDLVNETHDPAIPLLGIYLDKTIIQKDTCTPMLTAALFRIARTRKQFICPSTEE